MNINILNKSLITLKNGYEVLTTTHYENSAVNEMLADSCVKRFEYTIESSIKIMKRFLKKVYAVDEKDLTVNNAFRLMEGYGFITSWETWKLYYENRNNTAHEYDIDKSRELLKFIPDFIEDATFLLENLKKKLEQSND